MNAKIYSGLFKKLQQKLIFHTRLLDKKTKANSFANTELKNIIQRIYVINLDRKPNRWHQVSQELKRIKNIKGKPIFDITRRFSAIDARYLNKSIDEKILYPYFSLADQLKVEPNHLLQIDANSEAYRITMTPQEIAIALSHIEVWRLVAKSNIPYTLILEDDIFFCYGFARKLDAVWLDIITNRLFEGTAFDILFLSFQEVGVISQNNKSKTRLVHKPNRGIWQASGYVLSKTGAQKLIEMLPVYGPIDLWLNLQFDKLNVLLTKNPIIEQRGDIPSSNSYSIMPVLSQLGVYTREKPLVAQIQKLPGPIFAFGNPNTGLTSLAMALSVLGYTCCNDLVELPVQEQRNLFMIRHQRHFNAYVNINSLSSQINELIKLYPKAKFIFTTQNTIQTPLTGEQALYLPDDYRDKWAALCEFLKCEYPTSSYPVYPDIGHQKINENYCQSINRLSIKQLRLDTSPWIISSKNWNGISITKDDSKYASRDVLIWKGREILNNRYFWKLRDDTFPSNLSIFTPDNIEADTTDVLHLSLHEEQSNNIRSFTSAAIATHQKFLYGKFIAELKPSDVRGLVTGMFLHRNSPHQEIDIEFLGKDTTKMLINVFYNPGVEETKLEYGYRGTPVLIDLGFDAAKEFHRYEIEWCAHMLRWSVDGRIVHERVVWNPTPIPCLPMEFNVNLWYTRSTELAGKLDKSRIPAQVEIKLIQINNIGQ
ncbi:MAG: family 16 glycosylhydrolase [Christensenellales bacterium]